MNKPSEWAVRITQSLHRHLQDRSSDAGAASVEYAILAAAVAAVIAVTAYQLGPKVVSGLTSLVNDLP